MAYEKPGWKDVLQTAKPERRGSDDSVNKAKAKKIASLHYKRRKLDKDVKKYTSRSRICGSDIERIGRRHGFHVEESLFREDQPPHKNA